jgi:hypothetical protein
MSASRLLVGMGLGLATAAAWANPHRLDDSASYTVPPHVQMQWSELPPGVPGAGGMEASLRVNVRIDTRAWVGRSGRVYMALARDEASTVEANWVTQGRLQPGRVLSGERALVWSGTISTPALVDQLLVRLRTAADWQAGNRRLNFHFELDAD